MSGCRFGSPDLVTSIPGVVATPTFAFSTANSNYFGISGSYTSNNGAVCSFPTRSVGAGRTSTYAMTPIIVTTSGGIGRTTTCSFLAPPSIIPTSAGSTTYGGIDCPSITDNAFAPGTYTLRFSQPPVNGVPTISSRLFIIAAPTSIVDHVTATIAQTATAAAVATSTVTSTIYTSTATESASAIPPQTVIETVPGTIVPTVTVTDTVQSCAVASSSATSSTPAVSSSSVASSTPAASSSSSVASSVSDVPSTSSVVSSTSDVPSLTSSAASTPSSSLTVSPDGQCGGTTGQTCVGSVFGDCCSAYGYCGSTDIYCQASEGCQTGFGTCLTPSAVSSSALPTSTVKVSIDGTCGGTGGAVCPGSEFGNCCSAYGYCGSSTAHCGAGCQRPFGTCNGPSVTGTAPLPTSTLKVSLDGACGGTTGQTCADSDFGDCCSEYGYCGSSAVYCSTGCQSAFGTCSAPAKRAIVNPKLQAARFVAARRVEKRAVGAGPDFTYPPIPHTTVSDGVTQVVTVVPTSGVQTVTVSGVTTTTLAASSGSVTVTVIASASTTETVKETITACSSVV